MQNKLTYLEAIKKIYDKLSDEDKINFHTFLQSRFETNDRTLKDVREEMFSKLKDAETLSKEYLSRIFQLNK